MYVQRFLILSKSFERIHVAWWLGMWALTPGGLGTHAGSAISGRLLALSVPRCLCWKVGVTFLPSSQGDFEDARCTCGRLTVTCQILLSMNPQYL